MCMTCGCGIGQTLINGKALHKPRQHGGPMRFRAHEADAHIPDVSAGRIVKFEQDLLAKNNGYAEANRVAEQISHRPSWGIDRSFAQPNAIGVLRIEPGAVHTGDLTSDIRDTGDHCRPGFSWQVFIRPIVATCMETQAATMVYVSDSATLQICLGHSPLNRA